MWKLYRWLRFRETSERNFKVDFQLTIEYNVFKNRRGRENRSRIVKGPGKLCVGVASVAFFSLNALNWILSCPVLFVSGVRIAKRITCVVSVSHCCHSFACECFHIAYFSCFIILQYHSEPTSELAYFLYTRIPFQIYAFIWQFLQNIIIKQNWGSDCIDREVMTNVAAKCCHPSHDQWDVQVDEDVVAITGDIVFRMGMYDVFPRTSHFMVLFLCDQSEGYVGWHWNGLFVCSTYHSYFSPASHLEHQFKNWQSLYDFLI